MTSGNQQRHVTAAESPRWHDVINRDFPGNVADRLLGAGDKSKKVDEEGRVELVCWTNEPDERQQSPAASAAAAAAGYACIHSVCWSS